MFKTKEKCFSCGILHEEVECKGIYYCPNALCPGYGATWFRATLDSYEEDRYGHIVCEKELEVKGKLHNKIHGIEIPKKE